MDAFLQLPAPQRKVVREVILTFAKVYKDGDDSAPPHSSFSRLLRSHQPR